MNKEQMNQLDDFFADSTFSSTEIKLSEIFLQYCDYMDKLPAKLRKDENFDSWKYFSEIAQSKTLFKKKDDAPMALAVHWLSLVREQANIIAIDNEIPALNFTEEDLSELSHESVNVEKLPLIKNILLKHGIILVYQESIPGMKLDGASFLLDDKIPVIGMTLRYSRLDNFWFVLFHELSHIILHYDKLQVPVLDDLDEESEEDIEMDANYYAGEHLIPASLWRNSRFHFSHQKKDLDLLAKELSINPIIIVGKLHKETNSYYEFSDLLKTVNTKEILL